MEEMMLTKLDGRHKWKEIKRTRLSVLWKCTACGVEFKGITQEQLLRVLDSVTRRYRKRMIHSLFGVNLLTELLLKKKVTMKDTGERIILPVQYSKQVTK